MSVGNPYCGLSLSVIERINKVGEHPIQKPQYKIKALNHLDRCPKLRKNTFVEEINVSERKTFKTNTYVWRHRTARKDVPVHSLTP